MEVGKLGGFSATAKGQQSPEQDDYRATIGDSPRMLFSGSESGTQPALSYSPAAESGRTIHEVQPLLISGLHASCWKPRHCQVRHLPAPRQAGCQIVRIQYLLPVRMPLEGSLSEGLLDVLL